MVKDCVLLLLIIRSVSSYTIFDNTVFSLHIIHFNDFHARFEETSNGSLICVNVCSGGISRLYTAIHKQLEKYPNAIVLNAGDNFQGTIWYSIYKWNVTQHFMNKLPIDAYTLGNHEFDDKIHGVTPFIKALKAPVLVSNIDDSNEPDFRGLYKKSIVIHRDGKKIGIIGVILSNLNTITNTGALKFLDESSSVNREAQRLVAEENVDTIIVLSHCGYEIEKNIAVNASPKITVVVGAHTHTLLYNDQRSPNNMRVDGPYPTKIKSINGHTVLVVQAAAFGLYLGNLNVNYDSNGDAISWSGDPIFLDNNIPQNLAINNEINAWKTRIDEAANTIIGFTKIPLDSSSCSVQECNFGNFVADAMLAAYSKRLETKSCDYPIIALLNPGSIRESIPSGNISLKDLLEALPFDNTIDVVEVKGQQIKQLLEETATPFQNQNSVSKFNFLSLSNLRIKVNASRPVGSRVLLIEVRCKQNNTSRYKPLVLDKNYRVVLNSFSVFGGDHFEKIYKTFKNHKVGDLFSKVVKQYISSQSPIEHTVEGRIVIIH